MIGPSKAYLHGSALSKEGHTHTPASIGAATASHTHSGYALTSHTHSQYLTEDDLANIGSVTTGYISSFGSYTIPTNTKAVLIVLSTHASVYLYVKPGSSWLGIGGNYGGYKHINISISGTTMTITEGDIPSFSMVYACFE